MYWFDFDWVKNLGLIHKNKSFNFALLIAAAPHRWPTGVSMCVVLCMVSHRPYGVEGEPCDCGVSLTLTVFCQGQCI